MRGETEWKRLMAQFHITDAIGHLYRGNLAKMFKYYTQMDKFVKEVKRGVDDVFFIIISDHGMKPIGRFGDHSDRGFYSCNQELGLNNSKITDFFDVILKETR